MMIHLLSSLVIVSINLAITATCLHVFFLLFKGVPSRVQAIAWLGLSSYSAVVFVFSQLCFAFGQVRLEPFIESPVLNLFSFDRHGNDYYSVSHDFAVQLPIAPLLGWNVIYFWIGIGTLILIVRCYQIFLAQQFSIWSNELDDENLLTEAKSLESRWRISKSPNIRESYLVRSPLVVGVWKFTLLMPNGMSKRLAKEELRAILAHEYSHISKRDTRIMVLLILVECAFWFNPAVWLIHQRWAICRELDADDQALSYSTIEPKHFANLLLSVVSNQRQPWLQTAIGVTRDFKALKTRLLNMKSTPKTSFSSSLQAVATAIVVAAMFLLPWKITFASPSLSQSDNLVINGGFESALDSWHESTLPSGSDTQVKFGIDSGEKHSGKASLKFEKKENRYFPIQQLVGSLRSKIAVTRRFETTAWIKANQAGKLTMKAVFMDSSGESIGGGFVTYVGETGGSGRVTHDWKKYRSVVEVPASTKSLTFSIEMYGPGEVWIDDVSANFVDDATAIVDPFGKESSDTTDPLADIKDVPNVEFQAKKDPKKTYFLIGNKVPAPASGYKLLLVLPGGTGSKDFNPFVRRIWKNAELERLGFIIAQLAAPQWETSESRIVWPIRANSVGSAKFKTEEFVNDVIFDVKSKIKVDPEHIYAFGWSSGGPATYAALLDSPDIKGAFVAMSIFRKEDYPTLSLAKGRSLYLFQSPEDKVTNFTWAEKSKAAFAAAGVRTELVSYPGGHGFASGQPFEDIKNGLEWLTKR